MRKITLLIILLALSWTGTINAANWYVATTGADTNDGSSGTPFLTIAKAITSAASGDVINIAAGTYQVTAALNPGDKTLTFQGAGKATTFIQANTDGSVTNQFPVLSNGTSITANRTYEFKDVTIKNGTTTSGASGGGVYLSTGTNFTLTLNFRNVDFLNNMTLQASGNSANGGCFYLAGKINPTFTYCYFYNSKTRYAGGGGAIYLASGAMTVTIDNCYFQSNVSGTGGAIKNASTSTVNITIKNSTFKSNRAGFSSSTGKGGAICLTPGVAGNTTLTVENSTFYQNTAGYSSSYPGFGAALFYQANTGSTNSITLNHCTITGNTVIGSGTAGSGGGDGVCIGSAGSNNTNLSINNSVIIGNSGSTANASQVGTDAADQSKITNGGITNCILGGAATSGTSGIVGTWIDPNTTHNTLTAGTNDLAFGTITSDATPVLPIGNTSIARNYVSTNYLDPVLSTDQIGQSRVNATDAGAYENQLVQYTIAATAGTGGSIVSGAGNYNNGASCTLIAAANSGYSFVNWTEGGTEVSTNLSYAFTVSGARTLVANFAATASPDLTINTTSLTGFRYAPENGPSVEQSFLLTGANLTADVTITAPTNYEVSANSGTGFSSTAIISPSSGSLNNVPVYVRLKSGLTTNTAYNGETISVTTTGVSEQTVSCSGNITDALPTTAATNVIATNTLHTTTDLSWTAGDGAKYLVLVSTNSDVASAYPPVAGTTYTAGNTTHTGYIVGYVGSATSANITGLTAGTTNYLAVFAFNDNTGSSGYENYLVSTPAETNVTTIAASATNDYFRTSTSGNWSSSNIWESSTNGISNWHLASLVPGASATSAVITAAGSPLTITSDIGRTGFSMQDGSSLVWNYAAALSKTIDANGTIGITASALQDYSPVITGASTINISLGVSSRQSAEWSGANFPANAQVNFSTSLGSADLGIESGTFSGKKVNLGANVKLLKATNEDAGGSTIISIGELSGSSTSVINSGQVNGRTMAYNIGVLNTDATFAGQINNQDVSRILNINKVGTGNWTLSNANTGFTNGSFNVNAGTVTLASGAGLGTVPVTVTSGASLVINSGATVPSSITLATNGSSKGTLTLADNATVTTLTITSTSAPAVGTTIQVINATTPSSIVYTNTPVVPAGYSFNQSTGVLTYNGNTISGATNISTLPSNATITVNTGNTLTINQTSTVSSITVQPGAGVSLNSGINLTGTVALQSSTSGTATFVDADATGKTITGTIEQYLPTGRNWYVGVPVTDAATVPYTALTAAGASSVSYWNEATGAWVNNYTGNLVRGRGYIAVSNAGTSTEKINFSGTLNTGNITLKLTRTVGKTKEGFNLVANPYPSYLNPCALITSFQDSIEPTIWYRTKSGAYKFETVNTASGKGTGGVTGFIPPMQAFWVRVKPNAANAAANNGATLTFTNAMRYHANPTQSDTTVVTTVLKSPKQIKEMNIRLSVSNGLSSDETVLYTNTNASNDFDIYDSNKMSNDNAAIPEIYTVIGTNNIVINGFNQLPVDQEIPLGFKTGQINSFVLKANEITNMDAETTLILKDNLLNKETEMTQGVEYAFSSDIANTTTRFSLILRTKSTVTAVDTMSGTNTELTILCNANRQLVISGIHTDLTLAVYNSLGQMIVSDKINSGSKYTSQTMIPGVYVVKVGNETKKVVIK